MPLGVAQAAAVSGQPLGPGGCQSGMPMTSSGPNRMRTSSGIWPVARIAAIRNS